MTRWTLACLAFAVLGAFSQEAPPHIQLRLPGFFDTPFAGGAGVIELPDRPIDRLEVLVADTLERNIPVSGIRIWVNGTGASNIFSNMAVEKGTLLVMEPASLKKRPDELFDRRENTVEVMTTDKRGRNEYQNWILRTAGSRNSYFAYSSALSPDDPKGAPPDIIVNSPVAPPVFAPKQATMRINIKGTCASARAPVHLSIAGSATAVLQKGVEQFEQTLELRRGTKEINLEAIDAAHNRRTVIIPVVTPQINTPRLRFAGNRYAVVVGISRYGTHPENPPALPYAAADAAELARELETNAGFQRQNIRLLLDERATLSELKIALRDFAVKADSDDMLVVYLAARGVHDSRSGHATDIYLAPYGAMLSQIENTALSFDDIEVLLNRSVRSNHTFLVFDAGHGVAGDWRFPGRNLVNCRLLNLFSEQKGRAALVSGSADETSREASGIPAAGAFGHWLSRGLGGDADLNHDRVVTAEELFQFVSERVRAETGGAQNPRFRLPATSGGTPLTASPATSRVTRPERNRAASSARIDILTPARGFLPAQSVPETPKTKAGPEPARSSPGDRRVALVIGNARYRISPLRNPVHDAEDVKTALERLGFHVVAGTDLDLNEMRNRIDSFATGLRTGDVVFFFYAGHGMQIDGRNLLVPVDFDVRSEQLAASRCVAFDDLQQKLEKSPARLSILVMDACRNNPYHRSRGWGRGLALSESGLGSYLVFSASPGQVADDTPEGRNSVFTKRLLDSFSRPPALSQLFRRVRDGVWLDSQQTQRPYIDDQLIGDFDFVEDQRPTATAAPVIVRHDDQLLIDEGKRLYHEGKCADARQKFEMATRINPGNAFAQNAAGMACACDGLHAMAVERFKIAIQLDPAMAAAYLNRGMSYMADGNYPLAVEDFTWAIEEEPRVSAYYTRRGKTYFLVRKYDNAVADFDRAIELNPGDAEAFHGRGQVFQRRGDYRRALEDYTQALTLKPGYQEAEVDRANAERHLPDH